MHMDGVRKALVGVDAFAALSAISGGIMVVTGWPYQFPAAWLHGTPFSDYTMPGLILGVVVGGSALVSAFAAATSPTAGAITSFVAGFVMMGWIIGEILILAIYTWLQPLYFVNGLAMVVLALLTVPGGVRGIGRRLHLAG